MSAYVAIIIHSIKDEAAFSEYRRSAATAIAKHGGALVAPPSKPIVLVGRGETPAFLTLLSFPTKEAAKAWHTDPDLIDLHTLQNAGIDARIYAF